MDDRDNLGRDVAEAPKMLNLFYSSFEQSSYVFQYLSLDFGGNKFSRPVLATS